MTTINKIDDDTLEEVGAVKTFKRNQLEEDLKNWTNERDRIQLHIDKLSSMLGLLPVKVKEVVTEQ